MSGFLIDVGLALIFFLRDGTEATLVFEMLAKGIKTPRDQVGLRVGAVVGFGFVLFALFASHAWFAAWVADRLEPVSWLVPTIIATLVFGFGAWHFREHPEHLGSVRRWFNSHLSAVPALLLFASMAWVIAFEGLEFNANSLKLSLWAAFTGLVIGVVLILTILPSAIKWSKKRYGMARTMFWENSILMFVGPIVLIKGTHEFDVHNLLWFGRTLFVVDTLVTILVVRFAYRKRIQGRAQLKSVA